MENSGNSLTEAVLSAPVTDGTEDGATETTNFAETLVGEGRKYADTEALAKSYSHAELHIRELQEKLDSSARNDEALNEVLAFVRTSNTTTESNSGPDDSAATTTAPPNSVDIKATVDEYLEDRSRVQIARDNTAKALSTLNEKFGIKIVQVVFNEMIAEGKATLIDTLGREAPEELVTLIGSRVPADTTVTNSPGDTGRPGGRIATSNYEYTYTQAKELRKSNPAEYNSKSHRDKMAEMTSKHGEEWFKT